MEISNLQLIGLHLRNNKFTVLPLELKKLTTLQTLDLADNQIKVRKKFQSEVFLTCNV